MLGNTKPVRWNVVLAVLCVFFIAEGILTHMYVASLPRFTSVSLQLGHRPSVVWDLPVWAGSTGREATVRFGIVIPDTGAFPTTYSLEYYSEISSFSVEGMQLPSDNIGNRVDLAPYLHRGLNEVSVGLRVPKGFIAHIFNIVPSQMDPVTVVHTFFAILLVAVASLLVALVFGWNGTPLLSVLLLGVLLRCLYMEATPYELRSYDWTGHLAYIQHVAGSWTLPLTTGFNEDHQMPLYYFIAAVPYRIGQAFGFRTEELWLHVQFLSLVASIAAFFALLAVAQALFPKDGFSRLLFSALAAVFPALVHVSSQISNDALLLLFACLWLLILMRWWQDRRPASWITLCSVLALAMLTKTNAVFMVVTTLFCLVAAGDYRRFVPRLTSLGFSLLPASVLIAYRYVADPQFGLVANAVHQNPLVHVSNAFINFTAFDPLQMLKHPYIDNFNPATHPHVLFEYLFRSSQFGASAFGPDGVIVLVMAMFLIPIAVFGFIRTYREARLLPVLACSVVMTAGIIAFRFRYPYMPSQHVRLVLPLVVCACVFITGGTVMKSWSIPLVVCRSVVMSYMFVAVLFVIGIWWLVLKITGRIPRLAACRAWKLAATQRGAGHRNDAGRRP